MYLDMYNNQLSKKCSASKIGHCSTRGKTTTHGAWIKNQPSFRLNPVTSFSKNIPTDP